MPHAFPQVLFVSVYIVLTVLDVSAPILFVLRVILTRQDSGPLCLEVLFVIPY